jgi:pimeloyl-ACP methyl ester carboxylesterase
MQLFDRLWHKVLNRPYRAVRTVDTGTGTPVVLLHGLGSSSEAWSNVITLLKEDHRVIAFDLIGFGDAPKPDWINYDVDDHARAVISAMGKANIKEPVILTGHSMGCLVAVRIARLRPDLIDRLVLYEMPLYADVPSLKRYTLLRKMYFRIFQLVLKRPDYSPENVHRVQKIASHMSGFELSEETWTPYVKSLKNTIIRQHTAEDMRQLRIPMDLIYGSLDMVILRGHVQTIFDLQVNAITTHMVRSRHKITPRASSVIANRIDENIKVPVKKKKISKKLAKLKLFDNNSKQAV